MNLYESIKNNLNEMYNTNLKYHVIAKNNDTEEVLLRTDTVETANNFISEIHEDLDNPVIKNLIKKGLKFSDIKIVKVENLSENDTMIKKTSYNENVFQKTIFKLQEGLPEHLKASIAKNKYGYPSIMIYDAENQVVNKIDILFEKGVITIKDSTGITQILGEYEKELNEALYDYSEINRETIVSIYSFYLNVIEQYRKEK